MAQYRNAVMTQNGAALLNKAQAGLCKIKFTRMSTGDGQYSESEKGIEELRKITSLKSHKQSFSFDSIKYQDDTSVELKASITNHDDTQTLSAGYYIREIAVFAQEDDKSDTEVLYSISVADVADFLPTYNGNNPILIIQKYYVTVDESRSAITVPSHYGEDLDAVKEDLEKEWKEYAKNIDEEMKKRPEKDGKADEMTVTFTEAANRENIVTGEKNSTLMGKIKKWLADLAAAAFMQVVTSYSDLMAGTALDDYLIGAAAAKEGFTELNGKLLKYDKDKISVNKPNIAIGTNIIDGTAFTLSKGIYFITVKVQGISAITRNDQRIEFWVGNAKSRLISQVVLPHNTPYPIVTFASFANVIDEDTFNVYSYVDITTLSLFSVDIEIVKLLG